MINCVVFMLLEFLFLNIVVLVFMGYKSGGVVVVYSNGVSVRVSWIGFRVGGL